MHTMSDTCSKVSKSDGYKKAPEAPRRFKSAYMFFSIQKHRELRRVLDSKTPTPVIAKMVSHAWKDLTDHERECWYQMASRDKARYDYEKANYSGRWRAPKSEKPQRDPNAPKRPITAFLAFSNHYRESVRAKNPGMKTTGISKILAQMWRDAPEEERQLYLEQDLQQRKCYRAALQIYKAQKASDRKRREEIALKKAELNGLCTSILHQVVSFESTDEDNSTYTEETSFEEDEFEPLPLVGSFGMDYVSLQDCLDDLKPEDFISQSTDANDIMEIDWAADQNFRFKAHKPSNNVPSFLCSRQDIDRNVVICDDQLERERLPFPSYLDQCSDCIGNNNPVPDVKAIHPDITLSCYTPFAI